MLVEKACGVLEVLLTEQNLAEANVGDVKLPVFMFTSTGRFTQIRQVAAFTQRAFRYIRLSDFTVDEKPPFGQYYSTMPAEITLNDWKSSRLGSTVFGCKIVV